MKIHFCDICNESVPQSDLEGGRAVLRAGKVVCARCERSMTGIEGTAAQRADPGPASLAPPATTPTGARLATALALGALLLISGAVWLVQGRLAELERGSSRATAAVRAQTAQLAQGMERELGALRKLVLEELELADRERGRLEQELGGAGALQRERLEDLRVELARQGELVVTLESGLTEAARGGADLAQVSRSLQALRTELAALARRMDDVEALGALALLPVDEPPTAGAPPWSGIVPRLASTDAGERWSAAQALGETRDPAAAPHLVPLLTDEDVFVRMAAARLLGELRAQEAVPALIATLRDREASVREAAMASLRGITGRDFGFDPLAGESERERRVAAWEAWWEKEAGRLSGGG